MMMIDKKYTTRKGVIVTMRFAAGGDGQMTPSTVAAVDMITGLGYFLYTCTHRDPATESILALCSGKTRKVQ